MGSILKAGYVGAGLEARFMRACLGLAGLEAGSTRLVLEPGFMGISPVLRSSRVGLDPQSAGVWVY